MEAETKVEMGHSIIDAATRRSLCLNLLNTAKNDNEKLAGLLLVPKLFSASNPDGALSGESQNDVEEGDKQFLIDLLTAIDFQFLRRMISSGDNASSSSLSLSEEHVSLKITALSVFMCFTQQDVLTENQIDHILTSIEKIFLHTSHAEVDGAPESTSSEDQYNRLCNISFECLESLCQHQGDKVMESNLLPAIYRIVMKHTEFGVMFGQLVDLVWKIVETKDTSWMSPSTMVAVCAIFLQHIKLSELSKIDFSMCERASRFLATMSDSRVLIPAKLFPLIHCVMGQLCDSLKSKLPTLQRRQALNLLTSLIHIRGIKQLIDEKGSKAALLVIHLCSIEVRMSLEQDDNQRVISESETLCSSFFALEQMIFYMAQEETTLALNSKEILQVHSALQGAVSAIIYFLTSYASEEDAVKGLQPVVSACLRLLGAWTAEETESLLSKYIKVLPHLISICSQMLSDIDCFKFLVPGLSNFTTDTESIVEVMVQNLEFIVEYIKHCSTQIAKKEEYEHVLVNTCVVILNCLMMPGVTMTSPPLARLLQSLVTQTLSLLEMCNNLDCNITMVTCAFTTLRKLYEIKSSSAPDSEQTLEISEDTHDTFYRQAIAYMLAITEDSGERKSSKLKEAMVRSAEIPEIWLMGVQVMGDLMKKSTFFKQILIEEEHMRTALKLFEKHSTNVDVAFVLERLLLTMADAAGARDLVTKVNKLKVK